MVKVEWIEPQSPYLKPEEAARYCNVNYSTIWRAVQAGKLKAYGPTARAVRYYIPELDRWMQARASARSGDNHEEVV